MTCDACDRRIYPWQRFGWVVRADGRQVRWHADCGRLMARPGVSPRLFVGLAVAVAIELIVLLALFGVVFLALFLLGPAPVPA
jgi:hypothetical protein